MFKDKNYAFDKSQSKHAYLEDLHRRNDNEVFEQYHRAVYNVQARRNSIISKKHRTNLFNKIEKKLSQPHYKVKPNGVTLPDYMK